MQTRRDFMKTLALSGAAIYGSNVLNACSSVTQRQLGNIGYITGILGRSLREGDWQSILKQTAEMGYTEIETGSYLGDSAESYLSFLNDIGLKPIAGGIGNFTDNMDKVNEAIDKLLELKLQYAISYWPWFGGPPFDLEQSKRSAEILNKMGEVCKSRGMVFCWHNHDMEFKAMEEGLPFDYLMQNTDPELVKCELDIYWTQKGGADPVETMKKYPGRYPILHVKDMAPGEEQDFACPGEGIIDWPAVFNESLNQGIKHYFVERDRAEDGLGCLRVSAEYLKNLKF